MINQNDLSILERIVAPTPKLFAIIRNVGIILAALTAALVTMEQQGIVLPEWLTLLVSKAAGIAGAVAAIVAQLTVDFKKFASEELLTSVGDTVKKKR